MPTTLEQHHSIDCKFGMVAPACGALIAPLIETLRS